MLETTEDAIIIKEKSTVSITALIAQWILLIVLCVICFTLYWLYQHKDGPDTSTATAEPVVLTYPLVPVDDLTDTEIQQGITIIEAKLDGLIDPIDIGKTRLLLGQAQLVTNKEQAIETLKEVGSNGRYHPFTRARATLYLAQYYPTTSDPELTLDSIYTGDTWGRFLSDTDGSLPEQKRLLLATARALEYSYSLYPSPEAVSLAVAIEAQILAQNTVTETQVEDGMEEILEGIMYAQTLLQNVDTTEQDLYGDISRAVRSSTLSNIASALDYIRAFAGSGVSDAYVEATYRDALAAALNSYSYYEMKARYELADYLWRDSRDSYTEVKDILAPLKDISPRSSLTTKLYNRFTHRDNHTSRDTMMYPYHAETLRQLTDVSPELRTIIRNQGITDSQLSQS